MSIEIIHPKDEQEWLELRTKDITSTEIAALFGLSPYMTEFELWHRKKEGVVVKFEQNKRMRWGVALQDAIAAEIALENGWIIRRMNEYIRNPELKAGASFDFSIEELADPNSPNANGIGLLEIKNVDFLQFRDNWIINDDKSVEAPLHIEIQVQYQMMVSGRPYCFIGVLIGGNDQQLIVRHANPAVFTQIRHKLANFWKSIEDNNPPKPNFEQDAAFISKLYGYADPGKVMDVSGEKFLAMAVEYKRLADEAKAAEEKRKAIKAELLTLIGDSEKAVGDGFNISASMISGGPVSYVKEGYRDFRITWPKPKKEK